MSNIVRRYPKNIVSVLTLTKWTGSNIAELNTHYDVEFDVDGNGNLDLTAIGKEGNLVPVGHWFSPAFMGTCSDTEMSEQYNEVGSLVEPLHYVVEGS